jgi:hypothetical protein
LKKAPKNNAEGIREVFLSKHLSLLTNPESLEGLQKILSPSGDEMGYNF